MPPTPPAPSIATLARKTADARRVLLSLFGTDLGHRITLDLMGLPNPTPEQLSFARRASQIQRETLANSQLFLADPDMVTLLDSAAPTMPDQELHETDIITPNGFLYFADPLPDRSGQPPPVPIHAMSWAYLPENSPLLVDRDSAPSILITAYVTFAEQAEAVGLSAQQIPAGTPKYTANASVVWSIGSLIGTVFGDVPPSTKYTPGFYQRVMAAFWTLSQQPKMTTGTEAPAGQPSDQRRSRRAGVQNASDPVHVVRLHQRLTSVGAQAGGAAAGTGRKMTVRAAVRGHWRRQWYRSVQQHRHIWIDPHFRGPEDAPVVGGERVFLAHGPTVERGED